MDKVVDTSAFGPRRVKGVRAGMSAWPLLILANAFD